MNIKGTAQSGAAFSDCEKYRYLLWRREESEHDTRHRVICWLMLNPSTADENILDPTVTRCVKWSREWGYHHVEIANIFASRATDPSELHHSSNPIGVLNDRAIANTAFLSEKIICAWGNHGALNDRSREVVQMLKPYADKLYCLKMNKSGEPSHPLYLRGDTQPVRFFVEDAL